MTSMLVPKDIDRAVPRHSVNASMITVSGFEKLVREMLTGGGVTSFMFGSSRSGKTTFLINHMIPLFASETTVIAFLPNHVAEVYDRLKTNDEAIILSEMREDVISDIVDFQRNQMSIQPQLPKSERPKWTFVFDDVTSDFFKTNVEVSRLYTTYRNLGISSIIAAQYVTMAKKESRANVNLSIYFRLNTPEARMAVIKDHLPDLFVSPDLRNKLTLEDKANAYAALTDDYIIIADNLHGDYHILKRD